MRTPGGLNDEARRALAGFERRTVLAAFDGKCGGIETQPALLLPRAVTLVAVFGEQGFHFVEVIHRRPRRRGESAQHKIEPKQLEHGLTSAAYRGARCCASREEEKDEGLNWPPAVSRKLSLAKVTKEATKKATGFDERERER